VSLQSPAYATYETRFTNFSEFHRNSDLPMQCPYQSELIEHIYSVFCRHDKPTLIITRRIALYSDRYLKLLLSPQGRPTKYSINNRKLITQIEADLVKFKAALTKARNALIQVRDTVVKIGDAAVKAGDVIDAGDTTIRVRDNPLVEYSRFLLPFFKEAITQILSHSVMIDTNHGGRRFTALFVSVLGTINVVCKSLTKVACPDDSDEDLNLTYDFIMGKYDETISDSARAKIVPVLRKLQVFLSRREYCCHPLAGMLSPISSMLVRWTPNIEFANLILDIRNLEFHTVLLAFASVSKDHVVISADGNWLSQQELIQFVSALPNKYDIWYEIALTCARAGKIQSVDWLIERRLVGSANLLGGVIREDMPVDIVAAVYESFARRGFLYFGVDSKGKTMFDYFLEYPNDSFSAPYIAAIFGMMYVGVYKAGTVEQKREHYTFILDCAREKRKFKSVDALQTAIAEFKERELITKMLFQERYGIYNAGINISPGYNADQIKELIARTDSTNRLALIRKVDPSTDDTLARIKIMLDELGIKYIVGNAVLYVEYDLLKRVAFKVEGKGRKHKSSKLTEEAHILETANIQACGGGGAHYERKPKPLPVREDIATKFTETDRDAVYIRIQMERCLRLYTACSLSCTFDPPISLRVTIPEFKLHAARMLGAFYTDELAHYFYTLHHYDPKTATPAERSICSSLHSELKSREDDQPQNTLEDLEEVELVELVELRPRRFSGEKKPRILCGSIHLKAAAHEFLFLKGVFSWHKNLSWPTEIHAEILHDCMRLCVTRFYNAMLLYNQEGNENISINDSECRHLRNIMAHNVEIPNLREHVEKTLFPYGEKILVYLKEGKMQGGIIILRDCPLYLMTVQDDSSLPGYICRNAIIKLLGRANAYVALLGTKVAHDGGSELINCLNRDWEHITAELKIWIHHARAIESCILQIGQLSRTGPKFLRKDVHDYVLLCKESETYRVPSEPRRRGLELRSHKSFLLGRPAEGSAQGLILQKSH
jgi:hypothetical protein